MSIMKHCEYLWFQSYNVSLWQNVHRDLVVISHCKPQDRTSVRPYPTSGFHVYPFPFIWTQQRGASVSTKRDYVQDVLNRWHLIHNCKMKLNVKSAC